MVERDIGNVIYPNGTSRNVKDNTCIEKYRGWA